MGPLGVGPRTFRLSVERSTRLSYEPHLSSVLARSDLAAFSKAKLSYEPHLSSVLARSDLAAFSKAKLSYEPHLAV
jgi:hypothetical protein